MSAAQAATDAQPTGLSAWANRAVWHELETGFAAGLNFLRRWRDWRADAHRPGQLFYTAVDPEPVKLTELLQAAAQEPGLSALAQQLAAQWQALLPGVHRFVFEHERVLLTLCVGQARDWLPTLDAAVDQIWLTAPEPAVDSPDSPAAADGIDAIDSRSETTGQERDQARMLARLCLPGSRLDGSHASRALQAELVAAGFEIAKPHLAPDAAAAAGLQARYAPHWQPRSALRPRTAAASRHAVVVGGGLSGSAVAWSLAQRGWTVELLDQADEPAAGASALPAGLVAPHVSPDDGALSRLTRAGMRLTRQRAAELLQQGEQWAPSGVLEHQVEGKHSLPRTEIWQQAGLASSRVANAQQLADAGLAPGTAALWHGLASWLRPACLVRAQLDHPAIRWRGGCRVASLQALAEGGWRLLDDAGIELARAEQVVIAAAYDSRALLQASGLATPPLNPLRGQISWGALADLPAESRALLPAAPVNGHGCFMSGTPGPDGRAAWIAGSTFERSVTETLLKPEDQFANRDKLLRLLPALGAALAPAFEQASAWAGLRCTLPDRVPAVGPLDAQAWPGLHVCAGMGARGLTLSVLCGELLAALLHGEPWPVERKLAQSLLASRFVMTGNGLRGGPRAVPA